MPESTKLYLQAQGQKCFVCRNISKHHIWDYHASYEQQPWQLHLFCLALGTRSALCWRWDVRCGCHSPSIWWAMHWGQQICCFSFTLNLHVVHQQLPAMTAVFSCSILLAAERMISLLQWLAPRSPDPQTQALTLPQYSCMHGAQGHGCSAPSTEVKTNLMKSKDPSAMRNKPV